MKEVNKIAFLGKYQLTSIPNITLDSIDFINNKIFETVLIYQGLRNKQVEWYSTENDKYYYSNLNFLDCCLRKTDKLIWKTIDDDNIDNFTIKGKFNFKYFNNLILLDLA